MGGSIFWDLSGCLGGELQEFLYIQSWSTEALAWTSFQGQTALRRGFSVACPRVLYDSTGSGSLHFGGGGPSCTVRVSNLEVSPPTTSQTAKSMKDAAWQQQVFKGIEF